MATYPFPVPTHLISICYYVKQGHKLELTYLQYVLAGSCIWRLVLIANIKMELQRWPEKLLIRGLWNPDIAIFATFIEFRLHFFCTVLLYFGANVVESFCEKSNISVTNWLRYITFSSYLNKIWLSVWCHHLASLHILKTWISLKWKQIFENNKQHFSSHIDYLFMFQNGLDRKDAIFVIVPL